MTHDQHGLGRHVFCPKCGTGSSADDSYCSSCGRLLVTRTSHAVGSAVSEARPVPAAPRRLQVPAAAPPRLRQRNKWPAGKWFRAAVLLLLLGGVDVAHSAVTHRAAGSGGTIAFIAHGGKTAFRAAVTPSPEPFSNIALSLSEDGLAIFLTWLSTWKPYIAAAIAFIFVLITLILIRFVFRALRSLRRRRKLAAQSQSATQS